jgi:hypothetical protein
MTIRAMLEEYKLVGLRYLGTSRSAAFKKLTTALKSSNVAVSNVAVYWRPDDEVYYFLFMTGKVLGVRILHWRY